MAEFAEVMMRANRICESINACSVCPIEDACIIPSGEMGKREIENLETIVMNWKPDSKAPRYPTWEEWRVASFPNTSSLIAPCHFMTTSEWYDISGCVCEDCAVCRSKPIPAYIAKKLGVKPQGANA